MLPFRDTPESHPSSMPLVRGVRRITGAIRHHRLEEPLSWLGWLVSVAAFAFWTLVHYHAPASVPWIGMTIHTGVFAIWMLVVREWLALRARGRHNQPPGRSTEDT